MQDAKYIIDDEGTIRWFTNGLMHRVDGPACIYPDGREFWYLNGKHHREDGPALIYPDKREYWYEDGLLHREDGPAVFDQRRYGCTSWWYRGNSCRTIHEFALAANWTDKQLAEYILINGDFLPGEQKINQNFAY